MSKTRAQRFEAIQAKVTEASELLQELAEEIEAQVDNMPDNLRESARADALTDVQNELEGYIDQLDEVAEATVLFPGSRS